MRNYALKGGKFRRVACYWSGGHYGERIGTRSLWDVYRCNTCGKEWER